MEWIEKVEFGGRYRIKESGGRFTIEVYAEEVTTTGWGWRKTEVSQFKWIRCNRLGNLFQSEARGDERMSTYLPSFDNYDDAEKMVQSIRPKTRPTPGLNPPKPETAP